VSDLPVSCVGTQLPGPQAQSIVALGDQVVTPSPPLIVTETQADATFEIFADALSEVETQSL
jgi:adenosylmethionine-8-amino-7-oxononanoate aminotransferase